MATPWWIKATGEGHEWHLADGVFAACKTVLSVHTEVVEADYPPKLCCPTCFTTWSRSRPPLSIAELARRTNEWHVNSGGTTEGALRHLGEELVELALAVAEGFPDQIGGELSDIILMAVGIAGCQGIPPQGVEEALLRKTVVCETSEWIELSPGRLRRVKGSAYDGT